MADQQITLAELLSQMGDCATKMSVTNPTKRVLWIAAQMLVHMAQEMTRLRAEQTLSVRAESDSRGAIDSTSSV